VPKEKNKKQANTTRRDFLKRTGTLGAAALAGAAGLLTDAKDAQAKDAQAKVTWAEWFQDNFQLMTDEEKKECIARLEKRYTEEFGKKTTVANTPPIEKVLFGYALNIQKCIGCRRCVYACVKENNQSRHDSQIHWIRVIRMEKGKFSAEDLDKGYPISRLVETLINPRALPWRANTTTSPIRYPNPTIFISRSSASSVKNRPVSRSVP
jgi:molybdopterin-containing oxidoreductase family iron-sulfur binding subunit